MIRLLNKISDLKCSQESSRVLVLKTVLIQARNVLYIRTLLKTIQAGINNTNPLIKNLSRLLRKNLGSLMQVLFLYDLFKTKSKNTIRYKRIYATHSQKRHRVNEF